MNITEFAAYAGVSKAAVSRFFNGGYLSAEKKAAIAKAVEETGYRPSMQAQMMRTRRTKQIGVILPKLSSESCAAWSRASAVCWTSRATSCCW